MTYNHPFITLLDLGYSFGPGPRHILPSLNVFYQGRYIGMASSLGEARQIASTHYSTLKPTPKAQV